MKTIVIVLTISFIAVLGQLTDEQKANLREYKESCINETGVDTVLIENAKKGQIAENDEKLACFATCLLKKAEIINADGHIDWKVARSKFPVPRERLDQIYNACKHITETGCEKGGKLFKCFMDNNIYLLQ
ncbi:general odorant-binding protein 56a [Solenopsis invicta]|uniref:general odorant-binding protein 56a n=1 Tax=Solenopsis invicta TaxID=13686 RepID=UPI000E33F944|nr:general odorant-binding protein 56a [Solenopsis invicta]